MNTSLLSHTAPLRGVPSLPSWLTWMRVLLHRGQALQRRALQRRQPSEQTPHHILFIDTPLRFPNKGIYTPLEDWYGYR
jgi:hypothetical protein